MTARKNTSSVTAGVWAVLMLGAALMWALHLIRTALHHIEQAQPFDYETDED
jgi:hypothetical protein